MLLPSHGTIAKLVAGVRRLYRSQRRAAFWRLQSRTIRRAHLAPIWVRCITGVWVRAQLAHKSRAFRSTSQIGSAGVRNSRPLREAGSPQGSPALAPLGMLQTKPFSGFHEAGLKRRSAQIGHDQTTRCDHGHHPQRDLSGIYSGHSFRREGHRRLMEEAP
jgi:hypothetical protein